MKDDLEQLIQETLKKSKHIDPAAEELMQSINYIVDQRKLKAKDVLNMLARVSSCYIQHIKNRYEDTEQKDNVEDYFTDTLQIYLGISDINDMYRRIGANININ